MPDERKCRVCGCTNAVACVTPDGPCRWVAEDLCNACAETNPHDPKGLVLTSADLVQLQAVRQEFGFGGLFAFQLLASLQLALRHPKFPETMRVSVEHFARTLVKTVGVTPNLVRVAEAGFDSNADVSARADTATADSLRKKAGR